MKPASSAMLVKVLKAALDYCPENRTGTDGVLEVNAERAAEMHRLIA